MNTTAPPKPLTRAQLAAKIKALGTITSEQKKSIVCSLIGHSRIVTTCFGYVYCSRCSDQIGDTLGGSFDGSKVVIVGHDCGTCRKNARKLTWRDTYLAPNPFPKKNKGTTLK